MEVKKRWLAERFYTCFSSTNQGTHFIQIHAFAIDYFNFCDFCELLKGFIVINPGFKHDPF